MSTRRKVALTVLVWVAAAALAVLPNIWPWYLHQLPYIDQPPVVRNRVVVVRDPDQERGMEVRRTVAEDKGYVCWAWWRTDDKPGHHRCMLASAHQGLHECCCGAQIYDFGAGRDKVRAKLGKGECILTAAVTRAGTGT